MIDTDKYKGHTPKPWAYREDEVYAEGNPCIVALRAHGTDGELTSKLPHRWADFALIADAPLLLEAYKRLREEQKQIRELLAEVLPRKDGMPHMGTILWGLESELKSTTNKIAIILGMAEGEEE